jgi:hypothetical protein
LSITTPGAAYTPILVPTVFLSPQLELEAALLPPIRFDRIAFGTLYQTTQPIARATPKPTDLGPSQATAPIPPATTHTGFTRLLDASSAALGQGSLFDESDGP